MPQTVQALRVEVDIEGLFSGEDGSRLLVDWHFDLTFANGTSADQINRVLQDLQRALTTSGADIALDAVKDFQNEDLGAANVKVLAVGNLSTTAGQTCQLQPAATGDIGALTGASAALIIGEGGLILLINPTANGYNGGVQIGLDASASLNVYLLAAGDTGA